MLLEFSSSCIKVEVDIVSGKYKNFIDFLEKHNIKDAYYKEVIASGNVCDSVEDYLETEYEPDNDIIANIMYDDFTNVKWTRRGTKIDSPITIL